jgi:hypothetical protein
LHSLNPVDCHFNVAVMAEGYSAFWAAERLGYAKI